MVEQYNLRPPPATSAQQQARPPVANSRTEFPQDGNGEREFSPAACRARPKGRMKTRSLLSLRGRQVESPPELVRSYGAAANRQRCCMGRLGERLFAAVALSASAAITGVVRLHRMTRVTEIFVRFAVKSSDGSNPPRIRRNEAENVVEPSCALTDRC